MYKLLNNSHLITKPKSKVNEKNNIIKFKNNRDFADVNNCLKNTSIRIIDKMLDETMG